MSAPVEMKVVDQRIQGLFLPGIFLPLRSFWMRGHVDCLWYSAGMLFKAEPTYDRRG